MSHSTNSLGLLLCLVGCGAVPNRGPLGTRTPENLSALAAATDASNSQAAAEPSAQAPMDEPRSLAGALRQVLQMARGRAIVLAIVAEDLEVARSEEAIARRSMLPSVQVGARYLSLDGVTQATAGEFLDVNKQSYGLGAELRLVLDPAQAWLARRAAAQRALAAASNLQAVEAQVSGHVASLYLELGQARALEAVAEAALEDAVQLLALVRDRVEAGSGLALDLERSRASLASAERDALVATANAGMIRARLSRILDTSLPEALEPKVNLEREPLDYHQVTQAALAAAVESGFREHPAMARSRALVRAAEEETEAMDAEWRTPRLELSAALDGFGEELDDLNGRERLGAALVFDLSPASASRTRRARALESQARLRTHQMRANLAAEIEIGVQALRAERAILVSLEQELAAAAAARRLAMDLHQQGAGLLYDVLDAQSALRRAQAARVVAVARHDRALVALWVAAGIDPLVMFGGDF